MNFIPDDIRKMIEDSLNSMHNIENLLKETNKLLQDLVNKIDVLTDLEK